MWYLENTSFRFERRWVVEYNFDDNIFHLQSKFWHLILFSIREEIRTKELEFNLSWTWKELEERKFCLILCMCFWPWLNGVIKTYYLLNDDYSYQFCVVQKYNLITDSLFTYYHILWWITMGASASYEIFLVSVRKVFVILQMDSRQIPFYLVLNIYLIAIHSMACDSCFVL